jgi:hypothetical protein
VDKEVNEWAEKRGIQVERTSTIAEVSSKSTRVFKIALKKREDYWMVEDIVEGFFLDGVKQIVVEITNNYNRVFDTKEEHAEVVQKKQLHEDAAREEAAPSSKKRRVYSYD